ncbi:MAG: hypothetical protein JJU45_03875 [Acidimicrobiia bacterium]|nr:hypothetical protein [Acidimicrobiia bacterium]
MIDRPIFFVHIQKTAGGTLRSFTRAQLALGEVYPEGADGIDPDAGQAYLSLARLLTLPQERRDTVRAYIGHFPYVAAELCARMLDRPLYTVTLLREPVARTISYLQMRANGPQRRGWTAEQIYADTLDHRSGILNHQTRIYSLTVEDQPWSFLRTIDVDTGRLEVAKANLRRTDLVGVQERFDDFLDVYCADTGLDRSTPLIHRHQAPLELDISDGLRRQIEADTALDAELYRYALQLWEERHEGARAS